MAIPTYNRALLLERLLADLQVEAGDPRFSLSVLVVDDASTDRDGYDRIASRMAERGWMYVRHDRHHGRDGFGDLVRDLHARLRDLPRTDYYVTLADDFRLCESFLFRAITLWEGIPDTSKIALVPYVDRGRDTAPCWTGIPAEHGQVVDRVGWVDCSCISTAAYFEALDWSLGPVKVLAPSIRAGSGVGQAISRTLLDAGFAIYRSHHSLVVHAATRSAMHDLRSPRIATADFLRYIDGAASARTRTFVDVVTGHVCSIPQRRDSLQRSVAALLPQVDRLVVVLNGYDDVPDFLGDARIEVVRSQDVGDFGSNGKFWGTESPGYHVTSDDDVALHPDHVLVALHWIEQFRRRAVVGIHGAILGHPFVSYYRSRHTLHWRQALEVGEWAHVPGSGSCAWHSDTLRMEPDEVSGNRDGCPAWFRMSDIALAEALQRRRIPFFVRPHPANAVTLLDDAGVGIFRSSSNRDRGPMDSGDMQTRRIRDFGIWRRFGVDDAGEVIELDSVDLGRGE